MWQVTKVKAKLYVLDARLIINMILKEISRIDSVI